MIYLMTPNQVIVALSKIADGIDESRNPGISLVAQDISKVITSITDPRNQVRKAAWKVNGPSAKFNIRSARKSTEENCRRIASLMIRLAEEELGPWDLEEGERTELKWEDARKEVSNEEKLESKLKFLKRQIDKFIESIKSGEEPDSV